MLLGKGINNVVFFLFLVLLLKELLQPLQKLVFLNQDMSYSLNSFKQGYIGGYIGDYYRVY